MQNSPFLTWRRLLSDLLSLLPGLLLGSLLIFGSIPLAVATSEPGLAKWGLMAGLAIYAIPIAHLLRRSYFERLNLQDFAERAGQTPEGAGRVFLGVCLVLAAIILSLSNAAIASDLPANALRYLPLLQEEKTAHWPSMSLPSALAAQVETESCVSLKSPRCWSPRAELRTSRERGVGLGQITRTARFDALAELRGLHPEALGGWRWESESLYDPRLQLRALVLMNRGLWQRATGAASETDRLAFTFAGYNGGPGGVVSERRLCAATPGCDAGRWFGHVEHTSRKARVAVAGYGQSFFAINRAYVRQILLVRRGKYVGVMDA